MFDKVWTLPRAIEMLVENPSFPDTKNKQKKPKIFRPCPSNRTKHSLDKIEKFMTSNDETQQCHLYKVICQMAPNWGDLSQIQFGCCPRLRSKK